MLRSRSFTALLALLLVSLAVPLLLVPLPVLLDYPNHLVRLWLIGGGAEQGPFPQIYRLDWRVLTNIGVDLASVPLLQVLPVLTVGRIFLYLGAVLPVLGAVALNRTLFGGWSWWQLGFGLFAWHLTILAGFMNFNIGLGLALLGAAAEPWIARRGEAAGFLLRLAYGMGVAIVHVFGLFFYAALLCALALGPRYRPEGGGGAGLLSPAGLRRRLPALLRAAAGPVAALALLVLLSPALPTANEVAETASEIPEWQRMVQETAMLLFQRPGRKLRTGLAMVQTYRLRYDLICLALVLAPAGLALWRHRLRVHAGAMCVAAAVGAIFLLCPPLVAGAGWIDVRFAEMAALVLMVGIRPELPRRWAPALAGLMLAVVLARTGFVGSVWTAREADLHSVERALEGVPPGAAVLPLEHTARPLEAPLGRYFTDGFPTYGHLATLAVPLRHAFVPTLFSSHGKHPLSVLPPWKEISVPEGLIASASVLTDEELYRRLYFDKIAPYVAKWRDRFDYVLLMNADVEDQYGPATMPPELELVADEGFARLYRVRRATAATAAGG